MKKEEFMKKKISPLIEKIRNLCHDAGINALIHFEIGDDKPSDLMSTYMFGSGEMSDSMKMISEILGNAENDGNVEDVLKNVDNMPDSIKALVKTMKDKINGKTEVVEISKNKLSDLNLD